MAVGTAMDMTPTILIMTPVLMPVVKAAGIDPVYFGVLFIMNNAIGLITPPVGTVLNVVAGVGRMKMDEVTRGVLPFMFAQFAVMFLLVLFPSLSRAGPSGSRVHRSPRSAFALPLRVRASAGKADSSAPLRASPPFTTPDLETRPMKTLTRALAIGLAALLPLSAALAQDIKERTFKFALQNPKGHPLEQGPPSLPSSSPPRAAARSRSTSSPAARSVATPPTCRRCRAARSSS